MLDFWFCLEHMIYACITFSFGGNYLLTSKSFLS